MTETPRPALPPRLTILETLSESPIERTYRAVDDVLQREVMLKLPGEGVFDGWSAPVRQRLLREARALAKIRHANILPIQWVEETREGPLLVFDLPSGERLADRLQRGTLDVAETIELGVQVGQALIPVHACGIVHRAVGPSSIRVLAGGGVQLGSWTFAKEFALPGAGSSLAHDRRLEPGIANCLPDYSAPEQMVGQAADARADVFALGCTLHRCLTGTDPYAPGQVQLDLRVLRPDVGKGLAEVIQKCVLPNRIARYATMHDLVDALTALRVRLPEPRPRRAVLLAAVAGSVLLIATWALVQLSARDASRQGDGVAGSAPWEERYASEYSGIYERVHGLFVGIGGAYDGTSFARLRNPVGEIDAVAARLRANDAQWARDGAITRLAETQATMARILDELERIENTAGREDAVFFYYAGHGACDGFHFGLAAADVTGSLERGHNYLLREHLLNFVTRCQAKHVLVVLDCCHAGAVFDSERTRGAANVFGRDAEGAREGTGWQHHFSREFLCSAGSDEQARDGALLSPFCEALLEHLTPSADRQDRIVVARYLGADIARAMEQRSGNRCTPLQIPEIRQMRDQKGSFVFRLGAATAK
ncbi:MAG TPA: protein kinase [Planctomycetota bacterium]|nr:protein kinase [Planctomycetota bacterium]